MDGESSNFGAAWTSGFAKFLPQSVFDQLYAWFSRFRKARRKTKPFPTKWCFQPGLKIQTCSNCLQFGLHPKPPFFYFYVLNHASSIMVVRQLEVSLTEKQWWTCFFSLFGFASLMVLSSFNGLPTIIVCSFWFGCFSSSQFLWKSRVFFFLVISIDDLMWTIAFCSTISLWFP